MLNPSSFLSHYGLSQANSQSVNSQSVSSNQQQNAWPSQFLTGSSSAPSPYGNRKELEDYYRYIQQQIANHVAAPSMAASIAALLGESPTDLLLEEKIQKLKTAEARMVGRPVADYVEPIVGWRCWGVVSASGGLRLKALGQGIIWEPKKQLEAVCAGGVGHPSPSKDCQCGIWAFNTLPILLEAAKSYTKTVLGTVSLWGRMVQCENGWRAQYAYPKELWLLNPEHEQLGYIYGVPVRTP